MLIQIYWLVTVERRVPRVLVQVRMVDIRFRVVVHFEKLIGERVVVQFAILFWVLVQFERLRNGNVVVQIYGSSSC